MKKLVLFVLTIALVGITLCACGKTTPVESEPISYRQTTYFYGANADFRVRLIGGESEALFVADGKVTDVRPFVTLTVVPLHVDLFQDNYTFVLTGDKGEIEGALKKDSFGASYSAELADAASIGTPVSLRLTPTEESIVLRDLLADSIDANKAMQVAEETLKTRLDADDKEREIYIKYINDTASEDSPYYWYVAYIASPTDYYSVLVNDEGKVVSVNP